MVRLAFAVVIALLSVVPTAGYLHKRMTNIDVAANLVAKRGGQNDLIVVAPWYIGVSFDRYYRGPSPWITAPSIEFKKFHRFDLIVPKMEEPDQSAPANEVIETIKKTLQNGNSLYLVSDYRLWRSHPSPILPAAVLPRDGWRYPQYQSNWVASIGEALNEHADRHSPELLLGGSDTNNYERVMVTLFTGWH